MELDDLLSELAKPFDPGRVDWKPQATSGSRALAVAYADARTYQDRLNEVAGADWSDDYQVLDDGAVVLCRLSVCGVTRSDIGEAPKSDQNTATSALVQAFKRACVKFGVGRYLYDLPKTWVDYDPQRRRLTQRAMRNLQASLVAQRGRREEGHAGSDDSSASTGEGVLGEDRPSDGQAAAKSAAHAAMDSESSTTPSDPTSTPRRAQAAPSKVGAGNGGQSEATATAFWTLYNRHKGRVSREQAQAWAATGNWSHALEELRGAVS
ncbi:MAG: Rad52/Rad22 family DNA repair protein [Anaerolineae bacterium]